MKTICVSQSKFKKAIGYGSWGMITFTLIIFLVAINAESSSYHISSVNVKMEPFDDECFKQFMSDKEECFSGYWGIKGSLSFRFISSLVMNLINFVVIGLWIYYKQQKFKFSWCLKNGSES